MIKRYKIVVKGKVQGVGYRFSCMEAAYKYGVKGFVKNNADGTVTVEAEGEKDALQSFISWCKKGPLWARVKDTEVEEIEVKNDPTFEIKH